MIPSARGLKDEPAEYERLHHNLKLLDLITFESILDNYLEIAAKNGKSTIEIMEMA